MTAQLCPNCDHAALTQASSGILLCGNCGAHIVQGRLQCPACQSINELGVEMCAACGEPLTIVGRVLSRQGLQTRSQRLEQMRFRNEAIKEEERLSSDVRMSGFVEIDRRRIEAEHESLLAQQALDKRLFRNVAIGLGLFLLFVAIVSLVILL